MEARLVTAIVRNTSLGKVEGALASAGVSCATMSDAMGCGEHRALGSGDIDRTYVRVEVFAERTHAHEIARAIMEAASTGSRGDGLVAVVPVDGIWRIRTCCEASPTELT